MSNVVTSFSEQMAQSDRPNAPELKGQEFQPHPKRKAQIISQLQTKTQMMTKCVAAKSDTTSEFFGIFKGYILLNPHSVFPRTQKRRGLHF